jgi:hypothetical protein
MVVTNIGIEDILCHFKVLQNLSHFASRLMVITNNNYKGYFVPFQSSKNPSHARRVVVVLLTGQKLELMCDPCTTGQQLYETIVTHTGLPEFYFFGLTYISGKYMACTRT